MVLSPAPQSAPSLELPQPRRWVACFPAPGQLREPPLSSLPQLLRLDHSEQHPWRSDGSGEALLATTAVQEDQRSPPRSAHGHQLLLQGPRSACCLAQS